MESKSRHNSLYLRHHILLGIGDWGKEVQRLLALALENSHPELLHDVECLHLGTEGLTWQTWLPSSPLRPPTGLPAGEPQPDLQSFTASSSDLSTCESLVSAALSEAVEKEKERDFEKAGFGGAMGDQPLLDIHLVGRLDDALTYQNLFRLVETIRKACPETIKYRLFFYLGADTSTWRSRESDERAAIAAFANQLDEFLIKQADHPEKDDLGICYLVDTFDQDGRLIAVTNCTPDRQPSRIDALAELVAGFLSILVCSEIPERSEYSSLMLAPLVKSCKLPPKYGYCSAFSLSSRVFPLHSIRRRLILSLAGKTIRKFDPDHTADRFEADSQVGSFIQHNKLQHPKLKTYLDQEKTGQPVHFELKPSALDGIPADALVDRILSWKAMVERNKLQPAMADIQARSQETLNKARGWIEEQVDILVTSHNDEIGTAQALLEKLRQKLEDEKGASPVLARQKHWFTAIFSPHQYDEPEGVPDLKPLQRRLQLALGRRSVPLASCQRSALLAALESLFVFAAWPAVGMLLDRTYGPIWGMTTSQLGVWVALAIIILSNLILALYTIFSSEMRISRARSIFILAIQKHFDTQIKACVTSRIEEIYNKLEGIIAGELAQVSRLIALLRSVDDYLNNSQRIKQFSEFPCLGYEQNLFSLAHLEDLAPNVQSDDENMLYRKLFASKFVGEDWRIQDRWDCYLRRLLAVIEGQATNYVAPLSFESFLEQRRGRYPLTNLVHGLQSCAKIQLNLSLSLPGEESPLSPKPVAFFCVDDARISAAPQCLLNRNEVVPVSTMDRGRFSLLSTVHGIPLKGLRIWEDLK